MWPAFGLHDTRARINFALDNGAVQVFVAVDPRTVSRREVLENLEPLRRSRKGSPMRTTWPTSERIV